MAQIDLLVSNVGVMLQKVPISRKNDNKNYLAWSGYMPESRELLWKNQTVSDMENAPY